MKIIETSYKGYKFRSRLEARWAVFFDTCGVKWEYEPEGFDLGNGIWYLPDFLLNDVYTKYVSGTPINLWVEVKGVMTEQDAIKIKKFALSNEDYTGNKSDGYSLENPIILLLGIPTGKDFFDLMYDMQEMSSSNIIRGVEAFDFVLIDGDSYYAYPSISKDKKFLGRVHTIALTVINW